MDVFMTNSYGLRIKKLEENDRTAYFNLSGPESKKPLCRGLNDFG